MYKKSVLNQLIRKIISKSRTLEILSRFSAPVAPIYKNVYTGTLKSGADWVRYFRALDDERISGYARTRFELNVQEGILVQVNRLPNRIESTSQ